MMGDVVRRGDGSSGWVMSYGELLLDSALSQILEGLESRCIHKVKYLSSLRDTHTPGPKTSFRCMWWAKIYS